MKNKRSAPAIERLYLVHLERKPHSNPTFHQDLDILRDLTNKLNENFLKNSAVNTISFLKIFIAIIRDFAAYNLSVPPVDNFTLIPKAFSQ